MPDTQKQIGSTNTLRDTFTTPHVRAVSKMTFNQESQGAPIPGFHGTATKEPPYAEIIKKSRFFYQFDPIASTVVNRMVDIAITPIRHRKRSLSNTTPADDATVAFFNALAFKIRRFLKIAAREYLLHGMVIPEYTTKKVRGDLVAEALGRKKITYIDHIWARNPENILLKKSPYGDTRLVYVTIPQEDIDFITSRGLRMDGTYDTEGYNQLVEQFPEYVEAILKGKKQFFLPDAKPLFRNLTTYNVYPSPYLQAALNAMQHKANLKTMDESIAVRAIESVRHIQIGTDALPAKTEDIDAAYASLETSGKDRIFNWITPHTYKMQWVYPPLDVLVNDAKYQEPNADIFLALGFPRILVAGETLRSGSSDASIAILGPKSTLTDIRDSLIEWLIELYEDLADQNNFTHLPEPYFAPVQTGDLTSLVQFAVNAMQSGAISKDTVAQLYNSSWDLESPQIVEEQKSGVLSPTEKQAQLMFQQQQTLGGQKIDGTNQDSSASDTTDDAAKKDTQNTTSKDTKTT